MRRADNLNHRLVPFVLKSGSLNLLVPSGPVQARNVIALPLPIIINIIIIIREPGQRRYGSSATGWSGVRMPVGPSYFSLLQERPDRFWGPSSLLFSGTGGEAAGA